MAVLAKRSAFIVEQGMWLVTKDAGDLRWATKCARAGDEVFLLFGCGVRVILRQTSDNRYIIIADSVVYT